MNNNKIFKYNTKKRSLCEELQLRSNPFTIYGRLLRPSTLSSGSKGLALGDGSQRRDFRQTGSNVGFSLVGVLAAAFIALLVITALLSMLSQIMGLGRVSKNKFIAVNLAKEGIELVRNMRDSNWMYYPSENSDDIVQIMKWRGCAPGDTSDDCVGLKSLCNGESYTVDVLDDDLVLKIPSNDHDKELKRVVYGGAKVFTHQAGGTSTIPVFSRSIAISSVGNDEIEDSGESINDYLPLDIGCGESADISTVTNSDKVKPRGIIVTSRVTWEEPGTGDLKEVVLTGRLYDWLTQRP